MAFLLELTDILEKESWGSRGSPIHFPLNYDAYDLEYYIRGNLIFRVDETNLLDPEHHWPVLFLATGLTSTEYFLDQLERGDNATMDIPEGSYSISCRLNQGRVTISEGVMSGVSGEVGYQEFLRKTRLYAESVRAALLEMSPQFADHPELGEWFKPVRFTPSSGFGR